MAIERLSDRIAQDTCSVLLLLAFTLIRVSVLRSGAKNAHYSHILPSELFSVLCLVVTTCCVVVQVAVSEVDNRIKFSLKDPVAIDAHEYQPVTLQMNFIQSFMSAVAVWALKGAYISTFFSMSSALSRAGKRTLYGVTIFSSCSFVVTLLLHSLWCRPINSNWYPTLTPTGLQGCLYVTSLSANGVFMGLNIIADILIATMSITVILPLQVSKRVEWLALTFIIFIGLTSIAAAVTRYAVLVWIWTGPADRLTAGNFGLIELCVRLEIVFGAAAYGLCFARSLLRRAVRCLVGLGVGSGGRRKIVEEDVGRLKGVSLESGELEGPIGLEDLRRVGRLKAMSLESGERVGLEDLEGAERGYV